MVGGAFAVLDKSGILQAGVGRLVTSLGGRKYVLLLGITLFFMLMGSTFGIFEEIVPLVPWVIALANSLGWDSLVGLGMSILATNMGFSAAMTNQFTLCVAKKNRGLAALFWLGMARADFSCDLCGVLRVPGLVRAAN